MSNHDPSVDPIRATITKVVEDGHYVVTLPMQNHGDLTPKDSVTFNLGNWEGAQDPEVGQVVELQETHLYQRGWRAQSACPVTPQPNEKERH